MEDVFANHDDDAEENANAKAPDEDAVIEEVDEDKKKENATALPVEQNNEEEETALSPIKDRPHPGQLDRRL